VDTNSSASTTAEYVEVCFPAWPERAIFAEQLAAISDRVVASPFAPPACIATALSIPGAIATISVMMLAAIVAFVLLAPAALVFLAWVCWHHDRPLALRSRIHVVRAPPPR
jgi:hypothetical protein